METRIDLHYREWYDQYMKKSNNKVSQHKIKRANKNKKRVQAKPYISKFERKQNRIREELTMLGLKTVNSIQLRLEITMVDYDKLKKIPDELKQHIIKEHMKTYYHWTVGILSFLIGTFFGLLIK